MSKPHTLRASYPGCDLFYDVQQVDFISHVILHWVTLEIYYHIPNNGLMRFAMIFHLNKWDVTGARWRYIETDLCVQSRDTKENKDEDLEEDAGSGYRCFPY